MESRDPSFIEIIFGMAFSLFIEVESSRPLFGCDGVCLRVVRVCLQQQIFQMSPWPANLVLQSASLTQASARMILTRKGEQNSESIDPVCISRMKRSLSIQFRNGCAQVNHRDIKCDTKSSSSVTLVHGCAGTRKRAKSDNGNCFGSDLVRITRFCDSCHR